MIFPAVSYRNLNLLADAGRWHDLVELAAAVDAVPLGERREVAHVVALEAPAEFAAAAAELFPNDDEGFMGPLWEVIAHRPWRELSPYLTNPRTRHLVAQTRVLHGEDLRATTDLDSQLLGSPLCLQPWEAARWCSEDDMPTYNRTGSFGSTVWSYPRQLSDPMPLSPATARPVEHGALPVLNGLSSATRAYAFQGTDWEAASMVATGQTIRNGSQIPFADAYPSMVHLAAGERAYERPTGQALGRIALWKALAAMAGLTPPADPRTVTAFVERLRCVGWQEPDDDIWFLHLAMEDPEQGIAWVLTGNSFD